MQRAEGFYWCKNPSGEWEVSMWVPEGEFKQGWRVVRDWEIYQDSYFQEIDERRIERTDKDVIDVIKGQYLKSEPPPDYISNSPYICKPD